MSEGQDQQVSQGGTGYQAGGNLTIGMSKTDIAELMTEVLRQVVTFSNEAEQKAVSRFEELKEELYQKFASGAARAEALKDPDFQFVFREAHMDYARSGDKAVRENLVDIISRRSTAEQGSLEALALNDAATRAVKLTRSEFAALSIIYITRYTINNSLSNAAMFGEYMSKNLMPFVGDLPKSQASFWHMSSQSVGSIEIGEASLEQALKDKYGGLLGIGATEAEYTNIMGNKSHLLPAILVKSVRDGSKTQPDSMNKDQFVKRFGNKMLNGGGQFGYFTTDELNSIWGLFEQTIPSGAAFEEMCESGCPGIKRLFDAWRDTNLKNFSLNSSGIAIAHANAVRVIGFDAPLSVWIS